MTPQQIDLAFQNSVEGKSKVSADALNIEAMTTPTIKHLLNNLCSIPEKPKYLEVGAYKGGTFCSAISNHPDMIAYVVENFSEFGQNGPKELQTNIEKCKHLTQDITLFNQDCYQISKDQIPEKVNVYYYDGAHLEIDQYRALIHYFDFMDDEFIFIVDDYNDPRTEKGTQQSIKDLGNKLTVVKEWIHKVPYGKYKGYWDETWWNGFYVALIRKNKQER